MLVRFCLSVEEMQSLLNLEIFRCINPEDACEFHADNRKIQENTIQEIGKGSCQFLYGLVARCILQAGFGVAWSFGLGTRDVEAIIFQTLPLPFPHLSLPLPLPLTKTTVDNFFKLL